MYQPSKRPRYDDSGSDSEYDDISDSESDYFMFSNFESDKDKESSDEDELIIPMQPPQPMRQIVTPSASGSTNVWSSVPVPPKKLPFLKNSGIKINLATKEPIDYFNMIFKKDFYDLIIQETNKYALNLIAGATKRHSRIKKWENITEEELKIWLGLLFHMGTIKLNRLNDYWKKDELFSITIFSKCMSRDRFLVILRSLHFFTDTSSSASIEKIQPLIDLFNSVMTSIYYPFKNLSIDESLLLWRGHLIFKRQYIKGKKAKYGIKLYILAESNGLALKLIVYDGANDNELGGQDHTKKVVMKLLEGKTGLGYSVYMDNFYNSVPLTESLLDQDTYVTGTLRFGRKGNPTEMNNKMVKSGESYSLYKDSGICITKWKDKREVLSISSEFGGEIVETTNRRAKIVKKPRMIVEYNKNMSGTNFHDQMMAYYPCHRKTLQWYKKLAIHIFQTILLNSYYLYKQDANKNKLSFYEFRLSVIKSLLGSKICSVSPIPPEPRTSSTSERAGIHLPTIDKNSTGNTQRRRCSVCYKNNVRRDTVYCCNNCPKKTALCLEPCFGEFHKYR